MTSVARQVPGSTRNHHATPAPVTLVPQQPGGVKAFVAAQNKKAELNQTSNGAVPAYRKSVSISSENSPPPPPTRTTSARNAKFPYKEDVILREQAKQQSPSRTARAISVDRLEREDSVEREMPSSASDDMSARMEERRYARQRSHTYASIGGDAKPRPKNHFNTVQWRGDVRFNPYTGATAAQSIHNKFSTSQPQLNAADQEGLVMPNDRIKMSMFEHEIGYEEAVGEDYGSGYRPTLMKIEHGTIQKHAVAVTTPVAPLKPTVSSKMNRSGSDPNILESQLDRAGMTRAMRNGSGDTTQIDGKESPQSPSRREDRHSVSGLIDTTTAGLPTSDIARAYREHLLDKMERKTRKSHASTSSVSPSPSASSAESGTASRALSAGGLPSKLKNITPSQLQAIDVPDRAYYPRILPPPDSKQDQPAETLHNGGYPYNPFLEHSSDPTTTSYDVPDTQAYDRYSYSTLPRKMPDVNPRQVVNIGNNDRTQSVNEFHSPRKGHSYALQSQKQEWGQTNELTRSLGSVEQQSSAQPHQVSMPANLYSKSQVPVSGGALYWRNGPSGDQYSTISTSISGSRSSTQPSSGSNSQGDSSLSECDTGATKQGNLALRSDWRVHQNTLLNQVASRNPPVPKHGKAATPMGSQKQMSANVTAGSLKPSVMPKPAVSKRSSSLTPPPAVAHERSTSDPSLKYNDQMPSRGHQGSASPHSTSSSTLTPSPGANSSSGVHSGFVQQRPFPQQNKHQGQQISTSLLEIREADESEEKGKTKVGGWPRANFNDYVSLNSTLFPKRIRLGRSFSSGSADVVMSQGEEFDLHFVRSVKSVLMLDSSGTHYNVPLASVAKFSLIYNPFDAEKVAKQGFHFKTAGVLMDLRNPPNVVAATQSFDGGRAESSVEEGEILVLDGIKNAFHGRLLKAFSLKHRITKYIDEACYGHFSTNPDKIKMSLAQIYETSIPLPQKAKFHPTSSILSSVQASFQSDPVILKQFTMMKSVIATTPTSSSGFVPVPKSPAVSLSLDLEIDIREVSIPETRILQVQKKTQLLLDSFEKVSFIPYMDMPTTDSYMAQCALLLNLDPKLENYDTEITTPNGLTSPKRRRSSTVNRHSTSTQLSVSPATSSLDSRQDTRIKTLEDKYSTLESKVEEACNNLKKVSLKVDQIHLYLSKAQNAMTKHKKQEESVQRKSGDSTSIRPHSSAGVADNKISASSKGLSFDRADSRRSLKLSSESDSINGGGSDRRSLSDDVFVASRPPSASKPPTLPKPKDIPTKKLKRADSNPQVTRELSIGDATSRQATTANSHITEVKRQFSFGDTSSQVVSANPYVTEAKRKFSFGKDTRQLSTGKGNTLPANTKPVIAKEVTASPVSAIAKEARALPLTTKPVIAKEAKASAVSISPVTTKPVIVKEALPLTSKPVIAKEPRASPVAISPATTRPVIRASAVTISPVSTKPVIAKEATALTQVPGDSVDLKHYLLDSSSPKHKAATPKETASSNLKTTSTVSSIRGSLETDFDSIDAITDDLADWCTQVEDELTQLYNDSILSVS